jgi:DNA-binding CsgD family transcriptional regulator/tetratricopeptide (TPR) repeat protein
LVPDGEEVRFRHELGREVFEDELMPGERAQIHSRLATSLQSRRPDRLGEIARHWSAANDASRALGASVAAGRQALAAGASAEAETHLGQALELWHSVDQADAVAGVDHPALLFETATASFHARHLDRAIELDLRAAAELAGVDRVREAQIWLHLGHLYRFTNCYEEGSDATGRALVLIPESPPSRDRVEALADAALGDLAARRTLDALVHARQAVAVADAVGDPDAVVRAHNSLVAALGANGDYEGALAVALVNLERCGPDLPADLTLFAYHRVTGALADLTRYAEIPAFTRRGVELARDTGLGGPVAAWMAEQWVESLVLTGRWSDAERLVGELADLLDHPTQEGELAGIWGVALIRQGRLDEAQTLIERARTVLARETWSETVAWLAAAVVMFDAALGRYGEAEAFVNRVVGRDPPSIDWNSYLVAIAIAAMADSALAGPAGRHDHTNGSASDTATRWIEWMEAAEHDGRKPSRLQRLYRETALAQLGRLRRESDPQLWAHLAAGWDQIGFRYDKADAQLRHAEALLAGAAGRSAAARRAATEVLGAAHNVAHELRAIPLLTEIEDLTRRARLPLDTNGSSEPHRDDDRAMTKLGLTPREHEVLALLTRGRSNGEIAQELFISTKTASVHVSNILRKLGVTNRIEAAAFAERLQHR